MGRHKVFTRERIIAELLAQADEEGFVTYRGTGGGLRSAAEREFGSWREACEAANVKARPPGRRKKS